MAYQYANTGMVRPGNNAQTVLVAQQGYSGIYSNGSQNFSTVASGWVYFVCGYCDIESKPLRRENLEIFLDCNLADLTTNPYRDLILCNDCLTNKLPNLLLKPEMYHSLFKECTEFPDKYFVRVMSLESTRYGVKTPSHPGLDWARWLPPSLPCTWTLWEPKRSIGKKKVYICKACRVEHEACYFKDSDMIDHIASKLGRFKCHACQGRTRLPWPDKPENLYARHDDIKKHLFDTKIHEEIPEDDRYSFLQPNDQADILSRGQDAAQGHNRLICPTVPFDIPVIPHSSCLINGCECFSYHYNTSPEGWTYHPRLAAPITISSS